jgi:hypothetical protein
LADTRREAALGKPVSAVAGFFYVYLAVAKKRSPENQDFCPEALVCLFFYSKARYFSLGSAFSPALGAFVTKPWERLLPSLGSVCYQALGAFVTKLWKRLLPSFGNVCYQALETFVTKL